jgi:hypothetical protein
MKRLHLAPVVVALLLAVLIPACRPGPSGSLGTLPTAPPPASPAPDATGSPSPPPASTPSPAAPAPAAPGPGVSTPERTLTVEVWLTRDGSLFPTRRTRPVTLATSRLAMAELVAGPTSAESSAGVASSVAAATTFDVSIAGGVATVDLPGAFYDGGRDVARLRQAQVAYTVTQFPTVSKVGFWRDGRAVGAPVGRADYEDLLPPIVVTSVAIGDRVSSPMTVAGTANVFEATVSMRLLDATGRPLATTFTTATCGSGCRGDYSTTVAYRSTSEQQGRLQVYEVSAEDGSRIHVVDIPVRLAATG